VTTLIGFAVILVLAAAMQLFPSLLNQLGGTSPELGALLSSSFLLYPLASWWSGYASDRLGKRRVLFAGLACMAVPFAVSAASMRLPVMTASLLLFGVGSGILESQATALLTDLHPGRERVVVNLSQVVFCLGAVGGPAIVSMAVGAAGNGAVRPLLWGAAALAAALAVGLAVPGDERATAASPAPLSARALLRDPEWRLLALILFLYVAAENGTAAWLARYARLHLGLSESAAPLALAVYWAGLGVSRLLVAAAPRGVPDRAIVLAASAAAALLQIAAFSVSRAWVALLLTGLLGAAMGAIWPTLVALAGARFRDSSGLAVGLLVAAGACSVPLIQPVVGLLSEAGSLGLRGALLALSGLSAANFCLVALRLRPRPTRPGA
jgi:fucose permease